MELRRIRIELPSRAATYLSGLLENLAPTALSRRSAGASSTVIEAAFPPDRPGYLEDRVEAWLNALDEEGDAVLQTAADDGDWRPGWQGAYCGLELGSFFIHPPWTPSRPDKHDLIVDPRGAFGSGGHPATRLVFELLEELAGPRESAPPGRTLLDVGTGSGILALAAARLGFSVAATEINPVAQAAARAQAARNGVDLELCDPDLDRLGARTFDVVLANLYGVSNLGELAPALTARLAPGGVLVSGGYHTPQREQARSHFRTLRCYAERITPQDDWIALLFRRD